MQRAAAGLCLIALAIVAAGVLGVLLLVAIPLGAAALVLAGTKRWLRGLRSPNGPLDGRRNVRVVLPGPGSDASGAG